MKSEANKRLAQRSALITGAGTPVGRAICEQFAREGAWVVAVDGDLEAAEATAESARKAGVPAIALKTEALDPTITEHIVDTALQRVWQIDVLVNNTSRLAGGNGGSTTDWAATMAVNLEASYRFAWSVLPHMRKRRTGTILTVAWCWGDGGDPAERLARETSGAAVAKFTERLAELAVADGISTRALSPQPGAGDPGDGLAELRDGASTAVDIEASPEQVAEWVTVLAARQNEAVQTA